MSGFAVDAALVGRAQLGDRAALNAVLGAIQRPLFDHIISIVRDHDQALDVLQDVLMIVARKLPSLREPEWLRAWCYRIATRESVRHVKADAVWRDALRGEPQEALPQIADDEPFDADLIAALPARVDDLPPASRLVVRMHYLDGLSYPEIAEALGLPLGTVKSRLAYGREQLRRSLSSHAAQL